MILPCPTLVDTFRLEAACFKLGTPWVLLNLIGLPDIVVTFELKSDLYGERFEVPLL